MIFSGIQDLMTVMRKTLIVIKMIITPARACYTAN